jgi:hypothetical protein
LKPLFCEKAQFLSKSTTTEAREKIRTDGESLEF